MEGARPSGEQGHRVLCRLRRLGTTGGAPWEGARLAPHRDVHRPLQRVWYCAVTFFLRTDVGPWAFGSWTQTELGLNP